MVRYDSVGYVSVQYMSSAVCCMLYVVCCMLYAGEVVVVVVVGGECCVGCWNVSFSLSKFRCFERIERAVDDVREDVVLLTVWYGVDRMLEDRFGGCCCAAGEYYTEAVFWNGFDSVYC